MTARCRRDVQLCGSCYKLCRSCCRPVTFKQSWRQNIKGLFVIYNKRMIRYGKGFYGVESYTGQDRWDIPCSRKHGDTDGDSDGGSTMIRAVKSEGNKHSSEDKFKPDAAMQP